MQKQLIGLNIHNRYNIVRFNGVNKFLIQEQDMMIFSDQFSNGTTKSNKWDLGSMAIAISHMKIWQRVVEENKWCVVLEDDAVIDTSSGVPEISLPPSAGLISLFPDGINTFQTYNNRYGIIKSEQYKNHGLVGYYINPEFAKQLLEQIHSLDRSIDHFVYDQNYTTNFLLYVTIKKHIKHSSKQCSLRSTVSS